MQRSQINQILQSAQAFFDLHQFRLPPWANWSASDWQARAADCREIVDCQLGWDITDFGSGDFATRGLTLFTLRNADLASMPRAMPRRSWSSTMGRKRRPISTFRRPRTSSTVAAASWFCSCGIPTRRKPRTDLAVTVSIDGIARTVESGALVSLAPGESIA